MYINCILHGLNGYIFSATKEEDKAETLFQRCTCTGSVKNNRVASCIFTCRFVSLVGNTMSEERLGTIAKPIELGDTDPGEVSLEDGFTGKYLTSR